MNRFFSRLFNLRSGEGAKVFMLVLIFFLFITGTAWAETIIESSFYFLAGVSRLSQVFILHALVSLIATAVYSAFVDQTSNQKLLVAVCALASLAIGLGMLLLQVNQILAYTILYVLVRAVRTSFILHWWNYASDFYDARASKRIVPVINAASRFAIIVAGLTIPLLNRILAPTAIILLWVVTLVIIALLSLVMNKLIARESLATGSTPIRTQPRKQHISYRQNIREGFQYVSSSNYLRWLALSTFLMVIVFALLNYEGGKIFAQQFKTRAEMTNFIGYLNGITNLIMLPVQLFLFSRVVTKIGVGNANAIFPFGTFLISGAVLVSPLSLASGALAHFDRNTFRYSTQESTNNLLYNAVPARVKGRSRSFIDGLVLPVGLLASSAWLEFGKLLPPNLFLPVLLGLPALAYLLSSLILRKLYSLTMITLLEQEDYASLLPADGDITLSANPAAKTILLKKLVESNDDAVILLIARIMTETAGTSVLPILEMKAKESAAPLRAGIIDAIATAEIQSISSSSLVRFYTSFLRDPDENVRLAAFSGLKQAADLASPAFLEQAIWLLQDTHGSLPGQTINYEIRSQALAALLNSNNPTYHERAETALQQLLQDPDPGARSCALGALGALTGSQPSLLDPILAHLQDSSDEVRQRAIAALETRSAHPLPALTVQATLAVAPLILKDPLEKARLLMLNTLERLSTNPAITQNSTIISAPVPQRAYALIASTLADPSPQIRKNAEEILVRAGEACVPTLLKLLGTAGIISTQQTILKAVLCRINVRNYGDLADGQIMNELKTIYTRIAQLYGLVSFPSGPGLESLRTLLGELNLTSLDAIFDLLSARYGAKPVLRITQSLAAESSHTRANASEALEALISPALVKLIMPLFDSSLTVHDLARIGSNAWSATRPAGAAGVLRQLATDPQSELLRSFTVYTLGEIIPGLSRPAEEPAAADTSRSARARRLNLLDKLLDDSPKPRSINPDTSPGGAQTISLAEAQALITAAQTDPGHEVRSAAQAAARMAHMQTDTPSEGELMTASLTVIERIIFLKQVTLFQSMTIDQLKVLASICEDESVNQGTQIFKEGDPGGVVYVVVHGRIGIERTGDRKDSVVRLATLEARASFGEMNLFENSPRSANAIAIEDSLLLKLRAEPFLALIRQHPDMSIELIKVLNVRLREANDQIAHLTRSMPRQLQSLYDKLEDTDEK
ncbi:MAG: cyclic nucleotide-binding domain-containing protein [Chloroflexi bacterium]|nr:cyclic nucleotide-binding domain-containing protein [Chloroflexota bacterium]